MLQVILDLVPVAVLASVASIAWKGSKKFTTIEVKLNETVENTARCDKTLMKLGERVASVEGQLKRINGG
jgi:hypothetical protein